MRQGCLLSPILFNIFLERKMPDTSADYERNVRIGGSLMVNIRPVDDILKILERRMNSKGWLIVSANPQMPTKWQLGQKRQNIQMYIQSVVFFFFKFQLLITLISNFKIQLTLLISNSLISNNRYSRSENLVPVLTQRSTNRQQNIVEKRRNCSLGAISPLFHIIFNIFLT